MGQTAFPYNIVIEKPTHDALEESAYLFAGEKSRSISSASPTGGYAPTEN